MAVFGLEDATVRWMARALREAGAVAFRLQADLSPAAAHSVLAATDAGVHLASARQGMDATFLEYWQLLAEMGRARYVGVHDLGPVSLDINEAAAIAGRVLEEDVHPMTMPLLDDDESVIGVLDVVTGEQWFPDDTVEPPRADFVEAVAAETNVLLDESGGEVMDAVIGGDLAVAVTVESTTRAGVGWLAAHLPLRQVPASGVVLPGDDVDMPFVGAGAEGLGRGRALAVHGVEALEVEVTSLADVLTPGLLDRVAAGHVAAARLEPVPPVGSLLLTR